MHAGDHLKKLALLPGLQIITNGDLNDPNDRRIALARRLLEAPIDSVAGFLDRARLTTIAMNHNIRCDLIHRQNQIIDIVCVDIERARLPFDKRTAGK